MDYPFGQFWPVEVSCLGSIPSQLFVPFTGLGSTQHCLAATITLVRYQHCFSLRSKTQHHIRHFEEKISMIAETKTIPLAV